MVTFADLLDRTVTVLDVSDLDPDGPVARRGLLLAAHAGLTANRSWSMIDHWGLYTVAINEAITVLHADLPDEVVLDGDIPEAGLDDPRLRHHVRTFVGRLADHYAAAAVGYGSDNSHPDKPWRRQIWAKVAHRLDDAASQLI